MIIIKKQGVFIVKKLTLLCMSLLLVFSLAACGDNNSQQNNNNNNNQQQEQPIVETAGLKLVGELEIPAGQAEAVTLDIPELKADAENEILAGFDADIQAKLAAWLGELGEGESLNVNAYVLDTENYLSVVLTKAVVPDYGSDGEVYSYVYDKIVNNVMDVDYAKAWTSLEDDAIVEALTAYLAADQKWISFNVDGFYVDADEKPAYLLATKVRQEGAEDWVYVYVLKDGQILGNFSGVMEESNK